MAKTDYCSTGCADEFRTATLTEQLAEAKREANEIEGKRQTLHFKESELTDRLAECTSANKEHRKRVRTLTEQLAATKHTIVTELADVTDFEGQPITGINYLQGIRKLKQERDNKQTKHEAIIEDFKQVISDNEATLRLDLADQDTSEHAVSVYMRTGEVIPQTKEEDK